MKVGPRTGFCKTGTRITNSWGFTKGACWRANPYDGYLQTLSSVNKKVLTGIMRIRIYITHIHYLFTGVSAGRNSAGRNSA
eukprot:9314469-Pyramimonas_sp.AAC.1